ncbi:MAG: thioesterase family protein [Gammaproteobacteria bacterium]
MKPLPYVHDVIKVTQEMCDHNGHMNVNYYYQLFDSTYTSFYINELGFGEEYLKSGFSTFTLEDSIRYLNEFRLDEEVYPSFVLYKANKKLLHFVGILQNKDEEIAAIFETVLGHIDLNKRKIVNFPDDKNEHIQNVYLTQKQIRDIPFEIKLHIKDINE